MKGQGQFCPVQAVKLRLKVPDNVTLLFSNDGAPVSPQRLANHSGFFGFLFALISKGVGAGYGAFILLINS